MPRRTRLEYVLMGLIARVPMTGSALVRLLRAYPLAGIGRSPGAVYPALRRLESAGLIDTRYKARYEPTARRRERDRAWPVRGPPGPPIRRFREFRLTEAGIRELRRWATRPVTRQEMLAFPDDLLVRFGLVPGLAGQDAVLAFLRSFRQTAETLASDHARELAMMREDASPWGRLGVELVLELLETRAAWARRAAHELRWTELHVQPRTLDQVLDELFGPVRRRPRAPSGPSDDPRVR